MDAYEERTYVFSSSEVEGLHGWDEGKLPGGGSMWAGLGEYESEKWEWVGTRACLDWSPGWVCSAVAVAKEPGHELAGGGGEECCESRGAF